MTVYVDDIFNWSGPKRLDGTWCHMWSEDLDALHEVAAKIGLKRSWFQDRPGFPHYDLRPSKRILALKNGAEYKSLKEWINERRPVSKSVSALCDPS